MLEAMKYYWRWTATTFSFVVFSIGGILLIFFALSILRFISTFPLIREKKAQSLIHNTFRLYNGMMRHFSVLSYEIKDEVKLKNAQLVLAHNSLLIDFVFLIALSSNVNCIVKGPLKKSILTRGSVRVTGYIINDNKHVIEMEEKALSKSHI